MVLIEEVDPEAEANLARAKSTHLQSCARCGTLAAKRCARCKNAWYCSVDCQRKCWTAHKKECTLPPPPAATAQEYSLNYDADASSSPAPEAAPTGEVGAAALAGAAPTGAAPANMKALLKSLGLDVDEATAMEEAKKLEAKMRAELSKKEAPPVVLEGWWYESLQPKEADDTVPGGGRLREVAEASARSALEEGEWEAALEHLYTAMELTCRGDRHVGTLHADCCRACLALVPRGRDAYDVPYCDTALEHGETAVRLWPEWAEARGRRAAALEACGRTLEARDEFTAALRLLDQRTDQRTDLTVDEEEAAQRVQFEAALKRTSVAESAAATDQIR